MAHLGKDTPEPEKLFPLLAIDRELYPVRSDDEDDSDVDDHMIFHQVAASLGAGG